MTWLQLIYAVSGLRLDWAAGPLGDVDEGLSGVACARHCDLSFAQGGGAGDVHLGGKISVCIEQHIKFSHLVALLDHYHSVEAGDGLGFAEAPLLRDLAVIGGLDAGWVLASLAVDAFVVLIVAFLVRTHLACIIAFFLIISSSV